MSTTIGPSFKLLLLLPLYRSGWLDEMTTTTRATTGRWETIEKTHINRSAKIGYQRTAKLRPFLNSDHNNKWAQTHSQMEVKIGIQIEIGIEIEIEMDKVSERARERESRWAAEAMWNWWAIWQDNGRAKRNVFGYIESWKSEKRGCC